VGPHGGDVLPAGDRLPVTRGEPTLNRHPVGRVGPVRRRCTNLDQRLLRDKGCGRQSLPPSVSNPASFLSVTSVNLLSDVATHLLTVHRQSDRGIGQPQLVLVVHLQVRRDAAAVPQLVLEGRSRGNILNGTHDSLAALTDTLREVVGEVLTTNARPALPGQRPPLGGRTRCTTLGDTGDDADSLTDSLLRRRCADTASEVVSERAPLGVGVDAQAPRSRVGESATSRGGVVPPHTPRERAGERPTSTRGAPTSQGRPHTARQATPTGLSRNGAEALDKAR